MHLGAPLALLPEGQLPDAAPRQPVPAVDIGERFVGHGVRGVHEPRGFHGLRPGVGDLERIPLREPLLHAGLQRVVPGVSHRVVVLHIAEVGILLEQAPARDGRAGELRVEAEVGAGEIGAQVVDDRLIAVRLRAEVLPRREAQIASDPQPRVAVAYVRDFQHVPGGELPLETERPPLRIGQLALLGEESSGLTQGGFQAPRGARCRQQPLRKRILHRGDEGEAVVVRGFDGRGLTEAGLIGVGRQDPDGAVENPVPGPDHRLRGQLIGQPDARRPQQLLPAPVRPRIPAHPREGRRRVNVIRRPPLHRHVPCCLKSSAADTTRNSGIQAKFAGVWISRRCRRRRRPGTRRCSVHLCLPARRPAGAPPGRPRAAVPGPAAGRRKTGTGRPVH